jgi:hypothetical protein
MGNNMKNKKKFLKKEISIKEKWENIWDSRMCRFLNKCFMNVGFKKSILFISEGLAVFFWVLLVSELLFLYSIHITNSEIWMGGGRSGNVFFDNFGSIFIQNFLDNYFGFLFFPLLHFTIFFAILSIFMWLYYRNDKRLAWIGFKNFILSLLIGFMLIYFPIKVNDLDEKVKFMKKAEIAYYKGSTKILSIDERRELVGLYHSLYLEGLVSWRHDPLAVVRHELEEGRWRYYSREDDKLSIESESDSEEALYNSAVVVLENKKHHMKFYLIGQGDKENRVWVISSYKRIN